MKSRPQILRALVNLYRPKYIILNVLVAFAYYLIFTTLVRYQNYGILLVFLPLYLIYALIVTSSIMFTIGIYAAARSLTLRKSASASVIGTFMTLFAGVVAGCGCAAPLLYSITVFGLSIAEISVVQAFIASYSIEIISAMIILNVALILYYLVRLSRSWRMT